MQGGCTWWKWGQFNLWLLVGLKFGRFHDTRAMMSQVVALLVASLVASLDHTNFTTMVACHRAWATLKCLQVLQIKAEPSHCQAMRIVVLTGSLSLVEFFLPQLLFRGAISAVKQSLSTLLCTFIHLLVSFEREHHTQLCLFPSEGTSKGHFNFKCTHKLQ